MPLAFLIFAVATPGCFGQAATVPAPLKAGTQQNKSGVVRHSLNALRALRFELTADGAGMVSRSERRSLRINAGGSVEIHSLVSGRPAEVDLRLDGSNSASAVTGSQALPSQSNYFLGKDPAKWRTGVTHFEQARVEGVYPGIDLLYYGNGDSLEHDYQLSPGADPALIRMRIGGSVPRIDTASGDLIVSQAGPSTELLRLHKPVAYQAKSDGSRDLVAAAYRQNSDSSFSFTVGDYDRSRRLIIDPVITYSTYFGGSYDDGVNDVKLDTAGNIYLLVQTSSIDMPLISQIAGACNGMCGPNNPGAASYYTSYDYFVAKFDPTGQKLLFSTYIGGSGSDTPGALVLGTDGKIYLSGQTFSADFPLVNEHSHTLAPLDVYGDQTTTGTLTVLSADGSKILYSSLIGGGFGFQLSGGAYIDYGYDGGRGLGGSPSTLAVAPDGIVYLLGYATTIAPGTGLGEPFYDAKGADFLAGGGSFIAKFDTTKAGADSLIYAKPFGSPGDAAGWQFTGIALDSKQNLWVLGSVGLSAPLPTPDAVQPICGAGAGTQCENAFVFEMSPAGAITYATYLGGTVNAGGGPPIEDPGMIYIDSADNVYLSGKTESIDFPTKNAVYTYATVNGAHGTGFLTKLSPGGQSILYSTYLPWIYPIVAATPGGLAAAVGTVEAGLPAVNGFSSNPGLIYTDPFILLLDTTKAGTSSLVSQGYLGSTEALAGAVTFDAQQNLVLAGAVGLTIPVVNPYQSTCTGGCYSTNDGFLTRIQYQVGKLTLTPTTELFPNTNVGSTSAPLTATLTNSTAQTITLSVPSLTDSTDFTATDNCNGSIASAASCTITFTFKPSAAGTLSSTYSIADASQPGSPLTVALSGTGIAQTATLTPMTHDFGNVTVGSSVQTTLTWTNTGSNPETPGVPKASGAPFSIPTSGCDVPVNPGGSCTIYVLFSPTADGAATGSVQLQSNGTTYPSTLTGKGVGSATLSPASHDFGNVNVGSSAQATFSWTNTGFYSTVPGIAKTSGAAFSITANGCDVSVNPGGFCTIYVLFTPTTDGAATGSVQLQNNGITYTSTLTGTGVGSATLSPASHDFGNVTVGAYAQFAFTWTNTGPSPATTGLPTISGAAFSAPFPSNCDSPVNPGASCTIQVLFTPTSDGTATGSVQLQANGFTYKSSLTGTGVGSATLNPAAHDFGNVTVGAYAQFAFTWTNTGVYRTTPGAPTTSGSAFSAPYPGNCSSPVNPGASCTIQVLFTPTSAGTATGSVQLQANGFTYKSSLTGTGIGSATLNPAAHDFGNVTVGSTVGFTFMYTNSGATPATIGSLATSGNGFSIGQGTDCSSVAVGSSCPIYVHFTPTAGGAVSGTVHLEANGITYTSALTGTGVGSATLTPASHDFGNVTVGSSAGTTFTFANTGSNTVALGPIATSGSAFSIANSNNCGQLNPGSSCTLYVSFTPTSYGTATGSVQLQAGTITYSSSLTGSGVSLGTPAKEINFGRGFPADSLTLNGPAKILEGALVLTAGANAAASSAFYPVPISTASFETDFTFQLLDPKAEGITFAIQGDGPNAVGSGGGGLGYQGLSKSIALKVDIKDTAGEGTDSTGIYVDGAAPIMPAVQLADWGIDLHSGHVFHLHLYYDGKDEVVSLTDTVTKAVWKAHRAEDIPGIIGSSVAYFGFTAASGTPVSSPELAASESLSEKLETTASAAKPSATSKILNWTVGRQ